ncbi:MAG: hypothetical protein H0V82_02015 [Candidatus Protochlamydia sp.]|nr:hypothetical protein [Candidatus Protochlamydia sp.]
MTQIHFIPISSINPLQCLKEKFTQNSIVAIALARFTGISYALYQLWVRKKVAAYRSPCQPLIPAAFQQVHPVQDALESNALPRNETEVVNNLLNSQNNELLKSTQIAIENEDRTIVLPQDILGQIARHADFHPTLSNVCKGFYNT